MGEITGVKMEEVKIDSLNLWKSKKWRLSAKKGFLNVKIVKLSYNGTPPCMLCQACHFDQGKSKICFKL